MSDVINRSTSPVSDRPVEENETKGKGSSLRDAGYSLGATYVAWSGRKRAVQVILSLITWVHMSNIYTLEPHHFFL